MIKRFVIALFITAVLALAAAAFFYFNLSEKLYNSIFTDYISSDIITAGLSPEEKVRVIRSFVHKNIHPAPFEECRDDTVPYEKIVSGIGWCDQMSRVFMQIASKSGIRTRLLFLYQDNGVCPHSVAEAFVDGRWVLVDAAYDLELLNRDGKMASRQDIAEDVFILTDNPKVRMFSQNNKLWRDTMFLGIYYNGAAQVINEKKASNSFFSFLPDGMKDALFLGITYLYATKIRGDMTKGQFEFFTARIYHLEGDYDKAEVYYKDAVNDPVLRQKALFFLAMLYNDMNNNGKALKTLDELMSTNEKKFYWFQFAHGYRAYTYRLMGMNDEADKDFPMYADLPDAYF